MRHLRPPEPQPPTGGVSITPDQRMPPYCAVGALLDAPAPSLIRWTELSRLDGRVVARASYVPAPGGAPLTYCVKYGPDDRLGHEAALYAALFSPPGRDPVPRCVGYQWASGHHQEARRHRRLPRLFPRVRAGCRGHGASPGVCVHSTTRDPPSLGRALGQRSSGEWDHAPVRGNRALLTARPGGRRTGGAYPRQPCQCKRFQEG